MPKNKTTYVVLYDHVFLYIELIICGFYNLLVLDKIFNVYFLINEICILMPMKNIPLLFISTL